ncbi:MAG TPA: folylpolyglutamate synthase/dihydrofolate synthase family protein [Candidatus Andersenbacteria bacterium]|nr:folylpolyglutamate synthase/dihydrofolate synthase family protein [Candidatus Andersenbacteria bacterium]
MLARMQEELEYLSGLERFGIQPGLAVMEQLMTVLDHPEQQFKSIHVTGTNGKGSTCAMIESILRASGYNTALYTSPHLYKFNERIQINGVAIPDETLVQLIHEIRECIESKNIQPTFFEFTTALAFLYFARSNIDIAVIEVGMGGRWDATNVITPLVSVITNIGLDHTEFLGSTTAEIAQEKAGIIKDTVPVVTHEEDEHILAIFDEVAAKKRTEVIRAHERIHAHVIDPNFKEQRIELDSYQVSLPLLGAHQVKNMETAILVCTLLQDVGWHINKQNIMKGIAATVWEGRLQILSEKPLIIVDGAHNADGAKALSLFLDHIPSYDVLVFAAKKGKDISEMLTDVISRFKKIVITQGVYMPEDPFVIAEKIRSLGKDCEVVQDVREAVQVAISSVPPNGTVLIAGSLYMVPEALAFLKESEV